MPSPLFDPKDTNLAQLFMRAFYWADESLQNLLSAKGWPSITRAQSLVFVNIGEGVTRPSEIAARIGVTRQAIHQTLNELIELGYLELEPDPSDKRAKVIRYTDKGARLGMDALAALKVVEEELSKRIGKPAIDAMRQALVASWGAPIGSDTNKAPQ